MPKALCKQHSKQGLDKTKPQDWLHKKLNELYNWTMSEMTSFAHW